MKKTVRAITALLLVFGMIFNQPLSVLAAQNTYISDVKIGYGDAGKQALRTAGYTVYNFDANKGGTYEEKGNTYGSAVYIGYKTTFDEKEAITDMGLMNMGGNYSFTDWDKEVEAAWAEAERKVDRFHSAIEVFRENYRSAIAEKNEEVTETEPEETEAEETESQKETESIVETEPSGKYQDFSFPEAAYLMLNHYYEDDTDQGMGDLFLNENTTDKQLETVFMQGNLECLQGIEYNLALGCVEYDGDTFLKRIAEADVYALSAEEEEDDDEDDDPFGEDEDEPEVTQALDESVVPLNQAVSILIDAIGYTKLTVTEYRQRLENLQYYNSEETYLASLDDNNKASYLMGKQVYSILENTPYGNMEGVTLLDIIELSDTTRNETGLVLNAEAIAPLAKCMTAAQIGILEFVGLDTLLVMTDAVRDEASEEAYRRSVVDKLADVEKTYKGQTLSVYDGVDRSLFTDPESIALTGEAVKNRAIAEGTEFGRKKDNNKTLRTFLVAEGTAVAAAGLLTMLIAGVLYKMAFIAYSAFISSLVIAGVCVFVGLIWGIIMVHVIKEDPSYEIVKYATIPRVLVDIKTVTNTLNKREEKHYVPYYAAGNIQAPSGSKNTTELYGDLNGLSDRAQWLVLYYTKDELAGKPLLAGEMKVKEGSSFTETELKGYRALHILGDTAPENLNQYHNNEEAGALYAAVPAVTNTGSVFTDGNLGTVLAGVGVFAAGGLLSMLFTRGYYRKRRTVKAG